MKKISFLEEAIKGLNELISSIASILKIIIFPSGSHGFPKAPAHGKIILLGTGPSLSRNFENELDIIKAMPAMGVNHFAEKPEFEIIKPGYYMIGAPEIWNEDLNEYYRTKSLRLFAALTEKVIWDMILFIGADGKNSGYLEEVRKNPHIRIVFYSRTPVEGIDAISHWLYDRKWGLPRPHNVLIPSIMVSIWMGFNEIYLVGADHSWHENLRVTSANETELDQRHYYDKNPDWKPMQWKGQRDRKIHEVFNKWMLAFKGYHELVKYARHSNVHIFNASYKSYIDAFPRKPLTN